MGLIRQGVCKKCGAEFYWNIGSPWWFPTKDWIPPQNKKEEKIFETMNKWWKETEGLCSNCMEKPPIIK